MTPWLLGLYPAMVSPREPLGSSVTRGEFWNASPALWPSVATSTPVLPSKISTPAVVGTMASWYPPPVRSALTVEPMTCPAVALRQMVAPELALMAQIDPSEPTLVPSSTWSWPLPRTSARAGLLVVVPSSLSIQRGLQWASVSMRSLVWLAPL